MGTSVERDALPNEGESVVDRGDPARAEFLGEELQLDLVEGSRLQRHADPVLMLRELDDVKLDWSGWGSLGRQRAAGVFKHLFSPSC